MRLFTGFTVLFFSSLAFAANCTFSIKPGSAKVEWTGYKFTEKKAVKGEIKDPQFSETPNAKTTDDLIKGLKVNADLMKVDSGDAGRDLKLREFFFKPLKSPTVAVQVTSSSRTSLTVNMTMNGITNAVPFSLKKNGNKFTAEGSIDVLKFAMGKSVEALNKACKDLHKGADGVSKTWSTVDLKVSAEAVEACK